MDKTLESSTFLQLSVAFGFEPATEVILLHQIILTHIHQTRSVSIFWKVFNKSVFCWINFYFTIKLRTLAKCRI